MQSTNLALSPMFCHRSNIFGNPGTHIILQYRPDRDAVRDLYHIHGMHAHLGRVAKIEGAPKRSELSKSQNSREIAKFMYRIQTFSYISGSNSDDASARSVRLHKAPHRHATDPSDPGVYRLLGFVHLQLGATNGNGNAVRDKSLILGRNEGQEKLEG